jgi:Tol biopolymer transport system component
LLYIRGASAFARAFDATQIAFTGGETLIAEGAVSVSVASNGTMLYRSDRTAASRLAWFDRRGQFLGAVGEPGEYHQVTLSPRGTRATLVWSGTQGAREDLWDMDLSSGILSRLTTNDAADSDPSWSPDERRVAFTSGRSGTSGVYVKDVGTGVEAPLVVLKDPSNLDQWTPDGRFVIFRNVGRTIWSVAVDGDRTPRKLADTPYITDEVHVSADGRWVAYNANESGRWEAYIATFPEFAARRQVSSSGGVQPQWSRDGRELFYLAPDGSLMGVRVNTRLGLEVSPPSLLFATHFEPSPHRPQYAVSSDGARFLGLDRLPGERASLTLLLNGRTPEDWATVR